MELVQKKTNAEPEFLSQREEFLSQREELLKCIVLFYVLIMGRNNLEKQIKIHYGAG